MEFTLAIGIFALTESINEKSISATVIPVEMRSAKKKQNKLAISKFIKHANGL